MNKDSKIYVAGHRGLVGSAIVRELKEEGYTNLILKTRAELDLLRQSDTEDFFFTENPDFVFLAAAKVGGILANDMYKADFIYQNISIASHVIHSAYKAGVKKLINLGSSCIYPKFATQPIHENSLLTGVLESTNEPYAIAKIAAIKLCRYYNEQYGTSFFSAMPSNLYGPGDNFDLQTSHVLPALIRKFHDAKALGHQEVTVWGDGTPKREFLYSEDLARALMFLMNNKTYSSVDHINIGVGIDVSIRELAETIQEIVGFQGTLKWDTTKPNGTPKKCMDISKIHSLGWKATISLEKGIQNTYDWYLQNVCSKV